MASIPKTALVACSRLVDFAGSEIVTLEVAQALALQGVDVTLAALEIGPPFEQDLIMSCIRYIDLSKAGLPTRHYDLLWVSHNVVAYQLIARERIQVTTAIYSSLSHFEPLEAPPVGLLRFSRYLVNSEENLGYFQARYPAYASTLAVLPNAAPHAFLNAYNATAPGMLRSLAVVSNHVPKEIAEAIGLLRAEGLRIEVIGVQGTPMRVTPTLLHDFDAVVTIGKTVQYCLATGTPVFCYDRFGGPGWINAENVAPAARMNFSGRCTALKQTPQALRDAIVDGFGAAFSQREGLRAIALERFNLERNLLAEVEAASRTPPVFYLTDTDRESLSMTASTFIVMRRIIAENRAGTVALEQKRRVLEQQINTIYRSSSWRVTAPLRFVGKGAVKVRRAAALSKRVIGIARNEGVAEASRRVVRRAIGAQLNATMLARFKASRMTRAKNGAADDPLVSFVIPIYDRTDVLRTAIRSALGQTFKRLEVILVTDGSPPETMAVVNEFVDDFRVRVFNFPTSSGNAVRGRNKGIKEARGAYVAFLDSDDIAAPDRIERSLPLLESGEADVVYGAWRAVIDGTREIEGLANGQVIYSPDSDLEMLKRICVPCQSTVTVRRSLLLRAGFLKPRMQYREDHELWARLAWFGGNFKAVQHPLVDLRLHAGNNELNFKSKDKHWQSLLLEEYTKPAVIGKKIVFIVAGVGISGGLRVVLEHAHRLMSIGHDVSILNVGEPGDVDWSGRNNVPVIQAGDRRSYLLNNIDMLFATFWSTCKWLPHIPAARKLYFIQSDERLFYDDPDMKVQVSDTYLLPYEFVTIAGWIQRMLRDEFARDAHLVPNGLDTSLFRPCEPLAPKNPARPRVLIEGPITIGFKGVADAYAAVASLDCEIWIVSSAGVPQPWWRVDRFFDGVKFDDMPRLYSACDVLVKMSRVESFAYPPLEAMACGCAVVVGKVAGSMEYVQHETNALVVEQGDVEGARTAVGRLIGDEALRRRLVEAGLETARRWSWERSFDALLKVVNTRPTIEMA